MLCFKNFAQQSSIILPCNKNKSKMHEKTSQKGKVRPLKSGHQSGTATRVVLINSLSGTFIQQFYDSIFRISSFDVYLLMTLIEHPMESTPQLFVALQVYTPASRGHTSMNSSTQNPNSFSASLIREPWKHNTLVFFDKLKKPK